MKPRVARAAMKLVAYSFTAVWVAQIALLIPVLGLLDRKSVV